MCMYECVTVNAGVFVFIGFKCSFLVRGCGETSKKAEKSRTYGPPSVFHPSNDRETPKNLFKKWEQKRKKEKKSKRV